LEYEGTAASVACLLNLKPLECGLGCLIRGDTMRSFVVPLFIVCVAMAGCRAPCHTGQGVAGPGPGVIPPQQYGQAAQCGQCGPCGGAPATSALTQIVFRGPEGMTVSYETSTPNAFDSAPIVCPGHQEFQQNAIYRLRLSNIPGRPGHELYPTLEVAPAMHRTEAFLAHAQVPVQFTQEDLDQVFSGNYVTKVIYLPDREFQGLAVASLGEVVSTRLDPGVDPVEEAKRQGAILAVIRVGNKDLQATAGQMREGGIAPASFQSKNGGVGAPMPMSAQAGATSSVPTNYISGVTVPQFGTPSIPTPMGLPGPPVLPNGQKACLRQPTEVNRTPCDNSSVRVAKCARADGSARLEPCVKEPCLKKGCLSNTVSDTTVVEQGTPSVPAAKDAEPCVK
jgi:hypothetical protein